MASFAEIARRFQEELNEINAEWMKQVQAAELRMQADLAGLDQKDIFSAEHPSATEVVGEPEPVDPTPAPRAPITPA